MSPVFQLLSSPKGQRLRPERGNNGIGYVRIPYSNEISRVGRHCQCESRGDR